MKVPENVLPTEEKKEKMTRRKGILAIGTGVVGAAAALFGLSRAKKPQDDLYLSQLHDALKDGGDISDTLRRFAAEADLAESLHTLEEGNIPVPLQAIEMLDEASEGLFETAGFSERKVALLNLSNRAGQWASVLNINHPGPKFHRQLADEFKRATEAVRQANIDNTPPNARDAQLIYTHFEKIAGLHTLRESRHANRAREIELKEGI